MNFETALLQLVLTPVAVAAVIAYMTKGLFAQLLGRDLEHYKHQLQREGEQQKKLLEAVQFEQQTRFSWAHQKQAEVIGNVYGKLADAHVKVALMINPVQLGAVDREGQVKAAADAYNALAEYFVPNRVFLSEKRSDEVESVITLMRRSFNQFSFARDRTEDFAFKAWMEAWARIDEQVPPILKGLRREFRASLGIPE